MTVQTYVFKAKELVAAIYPCRTREVCNVLFQRRQLWKVGVFLCRRVAQ